MQQSGKKVLSSDLRKKPEVAAKLRLIRQPRSAPGVTVVPTAAVVVAAAGVAAAADLRSALLRCPSRCAAARVRWPRRQRSGRQRAAAASKPLTSSAAETGSL